MKNTDDMALNPTLLADAMNVSRKTIYNWLKNGLRRQEDGLISLNAAVKFKENYDGINWLGRVGPR